jgi:PEP-CTERM motif-containing protein
VNDPKAPGVRIRRRPTRRHRRNRLLRRILLASVFVLGGMAGAALLPFDFSSYLRSSLASHPPTQWNNADVRRDLALAATPEGDSRDLPAKPVRPVYPYSLVPGGVHDPKELEQVFEHDPVLASHYRGFDFRRARIVELAADRTVYVSYRIAGHVYWTTKKVMLHRGEKVITDGKTTLRTRCGNQVSETARQETSPHEPSIAKMEEPMKVNAGMAIPDPVNFDSSLTHPNLPYIGPTLPAYGLITNNGGLLSLYPPPLPGCEAGNNKKKGSGGTSGTSSGNKNKGTGGECGPPGEVPEPSTIILFATGLAGALARYRHKLSRT